MFHASMVDAMRRTRAACRWLVIVAVGVAVGPYPAAAQSGSFDWTTANSLVTGVDRGFVQITGTAPLVVNCLRIDTVAPGISFLTTPRANPWVAGVAETVRQTTSAFVSTSQTTSMKVVAAVNGDLFNTALSPTTTLEAFNVSNGTLVSPGAAPGGIGHATFSLTRSNAGAVIATDDTSTVGDTWNAVTGIYQCLLNGAPRLSGTDPQPRTGLGVSNDTRYVYMMTVDGRSSSSIGATNRQVGEWLAYFGAWNGVYVDGDRERIPYEADAYLNQLSHYTTDGDIQMARDTYDHLMANATWPTEWATHLIFMVHADWMHTGDTRWLAPRYAALKSKLLLERARADGLITSTPAHIKKGDLVDWPVTERDGFVFTPVNTVANAFYLRGLALMADLARVLKHDTDASDYTSRERAARAAFHAKLFDATRGVYRDGEGTDHASQHANLFPLAFGLVPATERARVTTFVASRHMACSVYAAQYLLEALFQNNAADTAHALIIAPGDRSWKHMVESGTTITWEAWDQKYKPNQDWNHAWGAAPANLFPNYVLGARVLTPGWSQATIRPHPGTLTEAEGKIPTPRGPILINWKNAATFSLTVTIPAGMTALVELPAAAPSRGVFSGANAIPAKRSGNYWHLTSAVSGTHTFEVR